MKITAKIGFTLAMLIPALCYEAVVLLILVFSGDTISQMSWIAYYNLLMPILYGGFSIFSCWSNLDAGLLFHLGMGITLLTLPLLYYSLIGFGLFIPVFWIIWFIMIRMKIKTQVQV